MAGDKEKYLKQQNKRWKKLRGGFRVRKWPTTWSLRLFLLQGSL